MLHDVLTTEDLVFTTHADAEGVIADACDRHSDVARFERIGQSEEGRPLYAAVIGRGERVVSLLAGAHADEPVGPETLRRLCLGLLDEREKLAELLERFSFVIVPHVNPDGEAANRAWIERWPDPLAFFQHVVREPPGRDIEFGYPAMRAENRAVAALLGDYAPFEAHFSLHGMAVSEGAWLLIDRQWVGRTGEMRRRWAEAVGEAGLRLFDWDRKGDKGFEYVGPGFSTTPRGAAMREHFLAEEDAETAELFHDSSMEFVRRLGGDPLCLVTELPLFVLRGEVASAEPGQPATYLRFKEDLPRWRSMLERGRAEEVRAEVARYRVEPLPLPTAAGLQLRLIDLAIETVSAGRRV
jgi:hypothetical protein